MNDISIVSHIKNDIEFLEQYWKHIHSYSPREIIIIDTGSIDGTYEKLLDFERSDEISYHIEQIPHYTGQVFMFNKVVSMATSTWIMKIDTDELYSRKTQEKIFETINENKYNCINLPTIHHFINSDLYFNCLEKYPDYHQRIFKREIFLGNFEKHSRNHGSIIWAKDTEVLTLGLDHPMYHYSLLRPLWKLQKRSIINYYIDVVDINDIEKLIDIENRPDYYIRIFSLSNVELTPAWQTEETLIPFRDLEDYYTRQFIKWGKKVDFKKPEDLIVDRITTWPKVEEILNKIQWT